MTKTFGILTICFAIFALPVLFAQESAPAGEVVKAETEHHPTAPARSPISDIAKGITIAIAALGGAIGQGKATASAVESISRNPSAAGSINIAMIIGLALIESLVIYAWVISFLI